MECIFCKIASHEIPSDMVYEDDEIIAFHDINPLAPVHVLVIPKKHYSSMNDISEVDEALMGKMLVIARNVAKDLQIDENGYKLLIRVGRDGGQEVDHLHLHLIGGVQLHEEIRPLLQ